MVGGFVNSFEVGFLPGVAFGVSGVLVVVVVDVVEVGSVDLLVEVGSDGLVVVVEVVEVGSISLVVVVVLEEGSGNLVFVVVFSMMGVSLSSDVPELRASAISVCFLFVLFGVGRSRVLGLLMTSEGVRCVGRTFQHTAKV